MSRVGATEMDWGLQSTDTINSRGKLQMYISCKTAITLICPDLNKQINMLHFIQFANNSWILLLLWCFFQNFSKVSGALVPFSYTKLILTWSTKALFTLGFLTANQEHSNYQIDQSDLSIYWISKAGLTARVKGITKMLKKLWTFVISLGDYMLEGAYESSFVKICWGVCNVVYDDGCLG